MSPARKKREYPNPYVKNPVMVLWRGQCMVRADNIAGSCNSDCYADKRTPASVCECICMGNNHGVGIQRARRQIKFQGYGWVEQYMLENELRNCSLQMFPTGGPVAWYPLDGVGP